MMKVYPYGVATITTRIMESGDGPRTVVFVHGTGARCDRWRANLPAFADAGYHCYAPDLPGHGFATKGANYDYSAPGFATFIAAFLRALPNPPFILIGASLGGHIAATVTCREPELVRALVLVGSTGLVELGEEKRQLVSRGVRDQSRASIAARLRNFVHDPSLITDEWIEEEYRTNNSPGALDAMGTFAEWIYDRCDADAVGATLAQLRRKPPILLVWGTQDRSVPLALGKKAQSLLGNPPLVEITDAGHLPYLEKPREFNAPVLDFLNACRVDAAHRPA